MSPPLVTPNISVLPFFFFLRLVTPTHLTALLRGPSHHVTALCCHFFFLLPARVCVCVVRDSALVAKSALHRGLRVYSTECAPPPLPPFPPHLLGHNAPYSSYSCLIPPASSLERSMRGTRSNRGTGQRSYGSRRSTKCTCNRNFFFSYFFLCFFFFNETAGTARAEN